MAKLNSKITALLVVAVVTLIPISGIAQSGYGKEAIVQSDSLKTKKTMENKIVVGKIEVPQKSIEAFRKQLHVTPNYLKKLPGFVTGEMYEMTDDSGTLHVLSITTWDNQSSFDNAQKKLAAFYKEINFDRMAFREKLNITADYALYVETPE
jgi:heme-degrading monooxygenase HmoA